MAISPNINVREFKSFIEDSNDGEPNRRVTIMGLDPSVSIPVGSSTHNKVCIVYYQYLTPVTTSAYVEIVSSTAAAISNLQIFDSSGQLLVLAIGPLELEVDTLLISPGGNGSVDITIPLGSRLSIKAVSADAVAGYLAITGLS